MFAVKSMREKAGMTQAKVAEHLGMSKSGYIKIEHEITMLGLDMAVRLADLFHCTIDELAGREVTAEMREASSAIMAQAWDTLNERGRDKLLEYASDLAMNPANVSSKSDRMDKNCVMTA